jgi:pilus assembly protein CpaB
MGLMKINRLWTVLGLAVVTGASAGYMMLGQLQDAAQARPAPEASTRAQVAVAARDLEMGAVLQASDVALLDWPGGMLPSGYAATTVELVGRGLTVSLRANEPILGSKLADHDAGGGLPILIPEGMRAVSVRVDEVIQVAGFVMPGTRVDVLVTVNADGPAQTRTILQNIQALAAGQTIARDTEGKPQTVGVITLLVTPEQAERLTLGASEGRIQLALRNYADGREVGTTGARVTSLMGAAAPAATAVRRRDAPAAPVNRGIVVETLRGGVRTLNTF